MDSSLQDLQQIFEYELKRKLSERAKFSSGEMRVLLNGFRFFDINYTGIINKSQWIQGILRTGLTGFSESDLDSLFILYDQNNTGQIDYKNFCSFLYGREPLNPLTNNSQSLKIEQNNNNNYDNNNQETNINMTNQNIKNNYSNYGNTPQINYNANNYNNIQRETPFINNNQRRQINSPNNYFNNNQNDNFGYNIRTPIDNVEYQENSNFRKSQRKINSYSNTFNNIFQQENNQSNFIKRRNYNLSESAINSIIMSIRNKININNGIKLFTFIKNLKLRESNNSQISINDLYNLFQEMRINVPYEELKILFNYANRNDNDIISTEQLINIIKGTFDEQRKLYIAEVFSNIDTEQTRKVSIQLLKNIFNAKRHPEVINGTKSKEEVLEQFCYSLDLYCEINGIQKNGELSLDNFVDYYSCVSASIPDEVYFEDMINGVWSDNQNINNNQNLDINYDSNNINNNATNNNLNDNNGKIDKNNNQYNMNSVLMGVNKNERKNDIQSNGSNSKNNFNDNYNYERKIKNSNSSPYMNENNNRNNQMRYNNNYRKVNNNNIINNIQSPYENSYNKPSINVPKGIENYQNKNKRRYNPILDEYYPEIPISNNNEVTNNEINSNNNFSKNNYQRNQIQNMNNISIINSNDINKRNNLTSDLSNQNNNNSNPLLNFRNILISRGPKSIFTFQRMLTIYDRNNSGLISLNDFSNIFQVYNLNIPDSDIKNIFELYNQNQSGVINYPSLINDLIGQMNEKRILIVEKIFNNFNKNEKGEVSLKEIKQAFNPGAHPDVLNGKKSSNEVYLFTLHFFISFKKFI